ncbi:hypothetical protein IG631_21059 [Alternaria alternata]|nr:hypothetical protein IG631_21059 [Alternaria alternata]
MGGLMQRLQGIVSRAATAAWVLRLGRNRSGEANARIAVSITIDHLSYSSHIDKTSGIERLVGRCKAEVRNDRAAPCESSRPAGCCG